MKTFLNTENLPNIVNSVATEQKCHYLYAKAML